MEMDSFATAEHFQVLSMTRQPPESSHKQRPIMFLMFGFKSVFPWDLLVFGWVAVDRSGFVRVRTGRSCRTVSESVRLLAVPDIRVPPVLPTEIFRTPSRTLSRSFRPRNSPFNDQNPARQDLPLKPQTSPKPQTSLRRFICPSVPEIAGRGKPGANARRLIGFRNCRLNRFSRLFAGMRGCPVSLRIHSVAGRDDPLENPSAPSTLRPPTTFADGCR